MKNKLGPNLTFLNIFELKGFRMFAAQQKQKCMKNLLLTSLIALLGISSFAQEAKKEATIKIIVIENGKEKVIERKYSDIQKADAEIKKLSDSLDLKISTSGGKNKIVRIEVNKDDRRGGFRQHQLAHKHQRQCRKHRPAQHKHRAKGFARARTCAHRQARA